LQLLQHRVQRQGGQQRREHTHFHDEILRRGPHWACSDSDSKLYSTQAQQKARGRASMKSSIFAGLLMLLALCAPAMARARIRVMILDGQSGGSYHNWRLTTEVMKKELEEVGLFAVTVVTAPPADGDFSGFDPQFGKYKVVVSNYDAPDWPAPLRAQ